MLTNQKQNDSEYVTRFKDYSDTLNDKTHQQKHTLYQNLELKSLQNITKNNDFASAQTTKLIFPDLHKKLSQETDLLTSYQIDYCPKKSGEKENPLYNKFDAENEKSMKLKEKYNMADCHLTYGQKTSGKQELETHNKNTSHLYYLLQSKQALENNLIDSEKPVDNTNTEDHFRFGTYHWRRSDVTRTFHPGLAYRWSGQK